jgi:leukotriene-A4 hydrolase
VKLADGTTCAFTVDAVEHRVKGSKLTIELPRAPEHGSTFTLVVDYETTEESTAVQWIKPEQTTGGVHPFMFTQCQAIHARSLVPCQDTSAVKITYSAKITAPAPLQVVCSAILDNSTPSTDGKSISYSFTQKISIPSYLLSITCGNLEFRRISDRCGVWAEPEVADKCQYEYAEMEDFVSQIEQMLIPYAWGRQDAVNMPFSYPYGGMETPNAMLCTPTLLAGDRSLMNVVIHEAVHSWSGNLVTSKSNAHFWLNESNDVFVERRVLGKREGQAARHLEVLIGFNGLKAAVDQFGHEHPYTRLVPPITSEDDPDDVFSSIPYEKGSLFLLAVEQMLDNEALMDSYLRSYFTTFAHQSIDSNDFKRHFVEFFTKNGRTDVLNKIDWNDLFYAPGMPKIMPTIDRSLADACEAAARKRAPVPEYSSWNTKQRIYYWEYMLEHGCPVEASSLRAMESAYQLESTQNAEIKFAYFMVAVRSGDRAVWPKAAQFLQSVGRMKFVRPLFRCLAAAAPEGKTLALEIFGKMRNNYHAICSKMVARDLGVE